MHSRPRVRAQKFLTKCGAQSLIGALGRHRSLDALHHTCMLALHRSRADSAVARSASNDNWLYHYMSFRSHTFMLALHRSEPHYNVACRTKVPRNPARRRVLSGDYLFVHR